ncbi:MAG: carbohydrate-binding domain-containing protein [Oscillospiraceae bacterium]|nr:carbohydrate-binding domain-containing protein [Oscillospiraceae bacterium]
MKKKIWKVTAATGLCVALAIGCAAFGAAEGGWRQPPAMQAASGVGEAMHRWMSGQQQSFGCPQMMPGRQMPQMQNQPSGERPEMPENQQSAQMMPGQQMPQMQNQPSGERPEMPENQQNAQMMPGQQMPQMQNQPSGERPEMPENQQNAQMMPGNQQMPQMQNQPSGERPEMPENQQNAQVMPDNQQIMDPQNQAIQSSADSASEIVEGITENSAMSLAPDYENATVYNVSESASVKITEPGTYIVTGTAAEGSVTVKKGTTGVVLVLKDLDLTSSSGAPLSVNKESQVQLVISGSVKLTDNEDPADETSTDSAVADAFDGAAIKAKANSIVYIAGDGKLTLAGNAKNGIKAGDDSSLVINANVAITAANDGINGNYDVAILGGTVTVSAGDDGIHADHILTIGKDGAGPNLTVSESVEAIEGTVVNIGGGKIVLSATDDGVNAANGDGVYEGVLDYSVNVLGGDVTITAGSDGFDSNGNVNLVSGSATIRSASGGGDAGIDYDGALYISDSFVLNNASGVAGAENMGAMPGNMGGAPGDMGAMPGNMGGMNFRPTGR